MLLLYELTAAGHDEARLLSYPIDKIRLLHRCLLAARAREQRDFFDLVRNAVWADKDAAEKLRKQLNEASALRRASS